MDSLWNAYVTWQEHTVVLSKAYFLYYFRAVLKRLALIRILNFKSISPYFWTYGEVTPLLIKLMTSQACNKNKVYIWRHALQIKCFELLIKVMLTVWASVRGKYKALDQCKCLACFNFLIDLRFYMVFTEGRGGEGRSHGTLIEWSRYVDVLVAAFLSVSFQQSFL